MNQLNETEKEILAAIFHMPNNYSLGKYIREKYWPLYEKIKLENPEFDPKGLVEIPKKRRGLWN